jgi:excinuclease ABC subunit C
LIQSKFGLSQRPRRMECFDISNFQGSQNVASQVVFEEGTPAREHYRRYKIKTVEGANDFASMKEVLLRRFKHEEYEDPDLIVIDGGKGQLGMAVAALAEIGKAQVPVVGLAKARIQGDFQDADVESSAERFFIPGRQNPVVFPAGSEALHILVGLRDEAHRFAITYHRKLREEASIASILDDVVGLGQKKKQLLLKKFSDVEAIRSASLDDLTKISGINRTLAERILVHLKEISQPEQD